MIAVSGETETRYYYHFDGLGSVIALSNNSGDTAETYSYDVFGEPNTTSTIGNPYLFTGRRYDSETALYYYRARYYAFDIGRFLQTDPIRYANGLNFYSYSANNPATFVDPSGLLSRSPVKKVHTPFKMGKAAMLKVRTERTGQKMLTYRIDSTTELVKVLITAKVTGDKITHLVYVGHGDVEGRGIGWTDSDGMTGIYPEGYVPQRRRVYTFESLTSLIQNAMTENAVIELRGCYTAKGGAGSICGQFQQVLPAAQVYGYTGSAIIETWFGTNWAKRGTDSEFVRFQFPKKECK